MGAAAAVGAVGGAGTDRGTYLLCRIITLGWVGPQSHLPEHLRRKLAMKLEAAPLTPSCTDAPRFQSCPSLACRKQEASRLCHTGLVSVPGYYCAAWCQVPAVLQKHTKKPLPVCQR